MGEQAQRTKVYISGPMTGIKDHNAVAFIHAEQHLFSLGHTAFSPFDDGRGPDWEDYMRQDLLLMLECEAIYMLTGWERSRGATLELHVATQIGMRVLFEEAKPKEPTE